MKPRAICLPCKQSMPIIGLGTWQSEPEAVEKAVTWALETGYRLIDTAYNYGNEKAIGKAIGSWIENGGTREELFVTTKLPNFGNRPGDVRKYLNESIRNLKLDYVDLYLIHHPFGFCEPPSKSESPSLDFETDHFALWKEMEAAVCSGLVKNIGLSNFNRKQLERIASKSDIVPANLQVELHVYLQQRDLIEACQNLGISVTAYAPLGSPTAKEHFKKKYDFQPNRVPDPMKDPHVLDIAKKWKRTPAQILLSFLMQMGIAVVPKSTSRERIRENFEALDFELDGEDMETLKCLDRGENGRLFDFLFYRGVEKHPEYPFHLKVT